MQQLRHPAPACRVSAHEAGGGVAVRGAGAEPAGTRDSPSTVLYWSFPGTALDVSLSRRWLAAAAQALWGAGDDADRLVLAYSEVATNAVVHGRGPVTVCVRIGSDAAACEIADCSLRPPRARSAALDDDSGRGLDLVAHTVDRLRVTSDETGKAVQFEIGRAGRAAPGERAERAGQAGAGSERSPGAESGHGPLDEESGIAGASEASTREARIPEPPHPAPGRYRHPGAARSSVGGSAGGSADGNPPRARPGPLGVPVLGVLGTPGELGG